MKGERLNGSVRVLFVCLGNICRSPMAEAVFLRHVHEQGLDQKVHADSAGTGHWHLGEPPHPGTRRILELQGIPYSGRARLITPEDLQRFDYIVPMDTANLRDVKAMGPSRARIAPLMTFAPDLGHHEVPDPYYDGRYSLVYELVDAATRNLLETIKKERGL